MWNIKKNTQWGMWQLALTHSSLRVDLVGLFQKSLGESRNRRLEYLYETGPHVYKII